MKIVIIRYEDISICISHSPQVSVLCETYLSVLESCNLDNELRDFVDLFWDLLQIKKSYNYEEIDHV